MSNTPCLSVTSETHTHTRAPSSVSALCNMCLTDTCRFVSAAELLSLQHLPCVSNLSWSTSQHRAWVKEAGLTLPDHQTLTRVSLLLIGCLKAGPGGEWRLTDASGGVSCQVHPEVTTCVFLCSNRAAS